MTIERVRDWIMPFGRHRGRTLAEIAAEDIGYLRWLVENVDNKPSIQRVVRHFLDQALTQKADR